MSENQKNYEELVKEKKRVIEKIQELESNDMVAKYLELIKSNEKLSKEERILYEAVKEEEYSSCEHIILRFNDHYDGYEKTYNKGCIKCGLNDTVLAEQYSSNMYWKDKIMYNYIIRNHFSFGLIKEDLHIKNIPFFLAKGIYTEMSRIHPNIDNDLAIKYFSELFASQIEKEDEENIYIELRLLMKKNVSKED